MSHQIMSQEEIAELIDREKRCYQCESYIPRKSNITLINITQTEPVKRFCCKHCRDVYIQSAQGYISKDELQYYTLKGKDAKPLRLLQRFFKGV